MRRFIGLTFILYALYLTKSAMGINLSANYSAPSLLKLPISNILEGRATENFHS
ncbi:hypothetical protein IQ266_07890 [filamentous cyanobacterium LEGE 11480]|uniref:Uncharacterized protein n=1 Tax=Romeriopsis navalis LEGE 11480 TaxID=2777977 RepID=A0A928VKY9_9CYAN|nr:hypothetical protein [Romeriopsis navalis]MBE9029648.1 hypothetical protein [Romeriopsis navalis LEGE 11480]